jgi:hypothetical protein
LFVFRSVLAAVAGVVAFVGAVGAAFGLFGLFGVFGSSGSCRRRPPPPPTPAAAVGPGPVRPTEALGGGGRSHPDRRGWARRRTGARVIPLIRHPRYPDERPLARFVDSAIPNEAGSRITTFGSPRADTGEHPERPVRDLAAVHNEPVHSGRLHHVDLQPGSVTTASGAEHAGDGRGLVGR